jgi:hypothetical protein
LKTFLTQIRPTLPLTPDPPVICFWKWIRWNDYEVPKKSKFGECFCQKRNFFLTHPTHTHPMYPPCQVSLPCRCPQPHTTEEKKSSLPKKLPQPCILGALLQFSRRHHLRSVPHCRLPCAQRREKETTWRGRPEGRASTGAGCSAPSAVPSPVVDLPTRASWGVSSLHERRGELLRPARSA